MLSEVLCSTDLPLEKQVATLYSRLSRIGRSRLGQMARSFGRSQKTHGTNPKSDSFLSSAWILGTLPQPNRLKARRFHCIEYVILGSRVIDAN
jgi:hypothetical protein